MHEIFWFNYIGQTQEQGNSTQLDILEPKKKIDTVFLSLTIWYHQIIEQHLKVEVLKNACTWSAKW